MLYYDKAVSADDPPAAQAARRWLLTYNRSDVEAAAALRTWLDRVATGCPSVEKIPGGNISLSAADAMELDQ